MSERCVPSLVRPLSKVELFGTTAVTPSSISTLSYLGTGIVR